jgi:hypothetical protein
VDWLPVFFVGEACQIALEPSQASAFPRRDVQGQLPDRVSDLESDVLLLAWQ